MKYNVKSDIRTKNYNERVLVKPPTQIKGIEKDFEIFLKYMVAQIIKRFRNQVLKNMTNKQKLTFRDDNVFFEDANFYTILKSQISNIGQQVSNQFTLDRINKNVKGFYSRLYGNGKNKFYNRMGNALGIDLNNIIKTDGLNSYLSANVSNTVDLVKNLRDDINDELKKRVLIDMKNGASLDQLTKTVSDVTGKSVNDALRIANNELNSFSANINDKRAMDIGVTRAIWRTSQDSVVRDTHKVLEGKEFDLKVGIKNPSTAKGAAIYIRPSQEINCRCYAEYIIPPLE